MPCLQCKHFHPIRMASIANASIQRWKPCEASDFDPPKMGRLMYPMDEEFDEEVKTYTCDKWEGR